MGRPLKTERVTPPLGYVSGQFTSNSPYNQKPWAVGEVTV